MAAAWASFTFLFNTLLRQSTNPNPAMVITRITASTASPATAPEGMLVDVSTEEFEFASGGADMAAAAGDSVARGIAPTPDWSCAITVPTGCDSLNELLQHCAVVKTFESLSQHQKLLSLQALRGALVNLTINFH